MRTLLLIVSWIALLAACSLPDTPGNTPTLPAGPSPAPTRAAARATPTIATPGVIPTRAAATPTEPTSTPTGMPAEAIDDLASIGAAVMLDNDPVLLAQQLGGIPNPPRVARTTPLDVRVGDVERFKVSDILTNQVYEIDAELRYAGPIVLMYVDSDLAVAQSAIERSAKLFEERIYQRTREVFGAEVSPGVDGDTRLTVLNTAIRGAGGYFSSRDGYVQELNRFSNERDMFLISIDSYPVGTEGYASTLAHEFQHMIHQNQQSRSPSWFNEGMSTLAEDLNGFTQDGAVIVYLLNPALQLNTWSEGSGAIAHYGASRLFLRYIYEQYGGDAALTELIRNDAGNNLDAFVQLAQRTHPDVRSFADLYANWATANLLNDPSLNNGRYAYQLLPQTVRPLPIFLNAEPQSNSVPQFGSRYWNLDFLAESGAVRFEGDSSVLLTGALPDEGRYAWWSNRGDESISTLTRAFDLRGVAAATMQVRVRYEIESDYDYAYASVSRDGGATWETLTGRTTTNDDPQGQNYGNGWTGVSGAPGVSPGGETRGVWIDEQFDLSSYAGEEILIRFWMVADAALNYPNLMIDNIRIPEIGYQDGAEQDDGGWEAQGFVRTTGILPQHWSVRAVTSDRQIIDLSDPNGVQTLDLARAEGATLIISGITPFTTEPANYALRIEPAAP